MFFEIIYAIVLFLLFLYNVGNMLLCRYWIVTEMFCSEYDSNMVRGELLWLHY